MARSLKNPTPTYAKSQTLCSKKSSAAIISTHPATNVSPKRHRLATTSSENRHLGYEKQQKTALWQQTIHKHYRIVILSKSSQCKLQSKISGIHVAKEKEKHLIFCPLVGLATNPYWHPNRTFWFRALVETSQEMQEMFKLHFIIGHS